MYIHIYIYTHTHIYICQLQVGRPEISVIESESKAEAELLNSNPPQIRRCGTLGGIALTCQSSLRKKLDALASSNKNWLQDVCCPKNPKNPKKP